MSQWFLPPEDWSYEQYCRLAMRTFIPVPRCGEEELYEAMDLVHSVLCLHEEVGELEDALMDEDFTYDRRYFAPVLEEASDLEWYLATACSNFQAYLNRHHAELGINIVSTPAFRDDWHADKVDWVMLEDEEAGKETIHFPYGLSRISDLLEAVRALGSRVKRAAFYKHGKINAADARLIVDRLRDVRGELNDIGYCIGPGISMAQVAWCNILKLKERFAEKFDGETAVAQRDKNAELTSFEELIKWAQATWTEEKLK